MHSCKQTRHAVPTRAAAQHLQHFGKHRNGPHSSAPCQVAFPAGLGSQTKTRRTKLSTDLSAICRSLAGGWKRYWSTNAGGLAGGSGTGVLMRVEAVLRGCRCVGIRTDSMLRCFAEPDVGGEARRLGLAILKRDAGNTGAGGAEGGAVSVELMIGSPSASADGEGTRCSRSFGCDIAGSEVCCKGSCAAPPMLGSVALAAPPD
jgi:hypothetical protein